MRKNEIITLEITGMTSEGNGVGKISSGDNAGMAVFVPNTAIGDVISCKIVKLKKTCAYGIISDIISPSGTRIKSDCPVSEKCGGCVFRHISYEAELNIKENFVRDAFERIGGFKDVCFENICAGEPEHYRNKAQYPVSGETGQAFCGFYAKRSHRVIKSGSCVLQPEIFGDIARFCLEYVNNALIPAYNEETGEGNLRHIYLRRGFHSGEIMLCFVVKDASLTGKYRELARLAAERFSGIKSVILNINPKNTNVILGEKNAVLYGEAVIKDTLCGIKTELSPMSFYQVNTAMAEKLYSCAGEYAALTGSETLLDLYCGAGTIGLSMASSAKKLIGCEIVPEAADNAKKNAAENGFPEAEFFCEDAGKFAERLAKEGARPDCAVIDPPRKGCDALTLESLIKMSPKRIVMISCDPSTAARDAAHLCRNGYSLLKVRAFDLFPRTGHVECAAVFVRN